MDVVLFNCPFYDFWNVNCSISTTTILTPKGQIHIFGTLITKGAGPLNQLLTGSSAAKMSLPRVSYYLVMELIYIDAARKGPVLNLRWINVCCFD